MRKLGITAVELGVQSLFDKVLKKNRRGHGTEETIRATGILKDFGFKVCYQMMPNLPGSTLKKDERMFQVLFSDQSFKPDWLKIYPTAVLKSAPLWRIWKKRKYRPYSQTQLISLLEKIKKNIPYYVRIQRIVRDIPSGSIEAGPAKLSNLRQLLAEKAEKEGWSCKCIRCRQAKAIGPKEKLFLFRQEYKASSGKEIFLSFEDKKRKILFSLLRLRIPGGKTLPVLENSALIREVHTYGLAQPIGRKSSGLQPQHKGLGKKLLKEAEKIAKNQGLKKTAVIAAAGVRPYYRKLGYRLKETYMVKAL